MIDDGAPTRTRPVLVTGASGFVGSAVTRCLVNAGYPVRALVRADSRLDNLLGLPVEIVRGDLRLPHTLGPATEGCAALFHVAADYRLWARDPHELYATNVRGTHNILLAARRAGIGRVVYTSSVATLGLHDDATPADEETLASVDDMVGHYKRSKFLAEALVRRFAARHGLDIVIVNPSTPVGEGDIRPTPTGRVIVDAVRGRMPAYVDTGLNVVHVDDVAEGHRLALERGVPGRRYVLGGENLALRDILCAVASIAGRRAPSLRLPHDLLMPAACMAEGWARLSGHVPQLTRDGLRLARKKMYFSSQRAEDELGYRARPAKSALADAVHWFRAHGYC